MLESIYSLYAALPKDSGGQFLFAGELNTSQALIRAANIAGAATLAASEDMAVLRQAAHENVIDFRVTTLDEALRILKNEIRKRETVAVCVTQSLDTLTAEMLERGVLPDLVAHDEYANIFSAPTVLEVSVDIFVCWTGTAAQLPALDAIAISMLPEVDTQRRLWIKRAPRFLTETVRQHRGVAMNANEAATFALRVREAAWDGPQPVVMLP